MTTTFNLLRALTNSLFLRSIIGTALMLSQGYSFGTVNHTFQLPMIRYFQGHNQLTQDLLLDILPSYTTYFYKAFAWLPLGFDGLERLFLCTYVLSLVALFAALVKIFDLLAERPVASLMAIMIIAIGVLPVLGLSPWQFKLDHSIPGLALALWALYFFLAGRHLAAFISLGVLFNIHALYAAHLFILFGLDMAWLLWRKRSWTMFKTLAIPVIVFSITAAPTIFWKLSSMVQDKGLSPEWVQIIHARLWFQVFFFDNNAAPLIHFLIFSTLLIFMAGRILYQAQPDTSLGRTRVFFLGILIFCLMQFLLADIIHVRIALEGQFWRASQFLALLGIFLIVDRGLTQSSSLWERYLGWTTVALLFLNTTLGLAALLVSHIAVFTVAKQHKPLAAKLAVLMLLAILVATLVGSVYWRINRDFAALLAYPGGNPRVILLTVLVLTFLYLNDRSRPRAATATLLAAVCLYGALHKNGFITNNKPNDPWWQAQQWARQNSAHDVIFLTPPELRGFRVYSDRAVVGEWKDGGMVNNNKLFALDWRKRMTDLGYEDICQATNHARYGYGCWESHFKAFDTASIVSLMEKYNASYLVTYRDHMLTLPLLWENEVYRIYRAKKRRTSQQDNRFLDFKSVQSTIKIDRVTHLNAFLGTMRLG